MNRHPIKTSTPHNISKQLQIKKRNMCYEQTAFMALDARAVAFFVVLMAAFLAALKAVAAMIW